VADKTGKTPHQGFLVNTAIGSATINRAGEFLDRTDQDQLGLRRKAPDFSDRLADAPSQQPSIHNDQLGRLLAGMHEQVISAAGTRDDAQRFLRAKKMLDDAQKRTWTQTNDNSDRAQRGTPLPLPPDPWDKSPVLS